MFELPASPFADEIARLGGGFIEAHPRSRAGDIRPRSKVRILSPYRRDRLSEDQRLFIGSTGNKTSASWLARRYNIGVDYVYKLRRIYQGDDRVA